MALAGTGHDMMRLVFCALALAIAVSSMTEATIDAKHPSDFVRVLEAGPQAQWDEAVLGLLGDDDRLDRRTVASVVRRLRFLEPEVRVRPVNGTGAVAAKTDATWRRTATGYQMLISCDVGERISNGQEFLVNLIVNEMLAGRERRAGQLALVGGGGWVYLRGDRESAAGSAIAEVR